MLFISVFFVTLWQLWVLTVQFSVFSSLYSWLTDIRSAELLCLFLFNICLDFIYFLQYRVATGSLKLFPLFRTLRSSQKPNWVMKDFEFNVRGS